MRPDFLMRRRLIPLSWWPSIAVVAALGALSGCDRSGGTPVDVRDAHADATDADGAGQGSLAPETPIDTSTPDASTPDAIAPDATDVAGPLSEALAAVPGQAPHVLDAAATLFLERYPNKATSDEAARIADIDRVLDRLSQAAAIVGATAEADPQRGAAACAATGKCDSGPVTGEAQAWLAAQREHGVLFVYGGEGTTEAAVAFDVVASRLEPGLSAGGTAYLHALAVQQRATAHNDEGGYGGPPDDLAAALWAWETVGIDGGEPYAALAETHGAETLQAYFRMSHSEFGGQKSHPLSRAQRASYRRFLKMHPASSHARAVRRFLAAMRKVQFKPTLAQLDAATAEATVGRGE